MDLPAGLTKAVKAFENRADRQQVLLFLGDGESAASPVAVTETKRTELGTLLADKDIQFVAVPLGIKVDAETLHGLTMQTGGAVVRVTANIGEFKAKLAETLAAPVLRVDRASFSPAGLDDPADPAAAAAGRPADARRRHAQERRPSG